MTHFFLIILKPFQLLPEKLAIQTGIFFGWIMHRILKFRYRIIVNHLNVIFESSKSKEEIEELVKAIYRHLGLVLIELLRLPRMKRSEINRKTIIHNEEYVQQALARGKGVFILAGHIGNWELVGAACHGFGYTVNAIGKEMKTRAGNAIVKLIRDDNGVTTIPRNKSMKQILKALKANEVVVVMLDQNMTRDEGVFAEFFGYQACSMPALAILAERSGAPILPMGCYRDPDFVHHHCLFLPEIKLENIHENRGANIVHNTQRFNNVLESIIRDYPDQWIWIHKRWRTRPDGEERSPFFYAHNGPDQP